LSIAGSWPSCVRGQKLGAFGITADSIHPGGVEGDGVRNVLRGRAELSGCSLQEETGWAMDNGSIRWFADPGGIAALAVSLLAARPVDLRHRLPLDGDSKAAQLR
jgi:NAD(P)-dependent dehydrogenase (short-subunit alcohol dehydrogenase family)